MAVTLPELCCLGRSRIVGVSDLDILATVANRGGSKRAIPILMLRTWRMCSCHLPNKSSSGFRLLWFRKSRLQSLHVELTFRIDVFLVRITEYSVAYIDFSLQYV
jgi:hypothetical protein